MMCTSISAFVNPSAVFMTLFLISAMPVHAAEAMKFEENDEGFMKFKNWYWNDPMGTVSLHKLNQHMILLYSWD